MIIGNIHIFAEMRDPIRDSLRATMHDSSGAAMLDGQRAGMHHRPGENLRTWGNMIRQRNSKLEHAPSLILCHFIGFNPFYWKLQTVG